MFSRATEHLAAPPVELDQAPALSVQFPGKNSPAAVGFLSVFMNLALSFYKEPANHSHKLAWFSGQGFFFFGCALQCAEGRRGWRAEPGTPCDASHQPRTKQGSSFLNWEGGRRRPHPTLACVSSSCTGDLRITPGAAGPGGRSSGFPGPGLPDEAAVSSGSEHSAAGHSDPQQR